MENGPNLLCEAGVIGKDICSDMLQVVRWLDEEWYLPIHNEQGTMAMTHMANVSMRSRKGEVIEALDDELLEELTQSHLWPTILSVYQVLLKEFTVTLYADGEGYMLMNLYGLWMATNKGV